MKSIHHSFDIDIAQTYGVEEAIIIHHFQHWISLNARMKRNFHDGCYWTYQSLDTIIAHFPYMTKERLVNIIEKLCTGKSRFSKKGEKYFEPVLKKGNFNKSKYDRTVWYAFCDSTKWILCEHKIEIGEPQNQDCKNTTPIPDTIKPYAKPEREAPPAPKGETTLSFGKHVKLLESEYLKLCEVNTKVRIDFLIEKMNNYLSASGRKPYKDYAAALRNWIIDEKPSQATKGSDSLNKSFFDRFKEVCKDHPHICFTEDSVEFLRGASPSLFFKLDDNDKNSILERLNIMGIKIDEN